VLLVVDTIEEARLEVETMIGAGEDGGVGVEVVHGVAAEIDTILVVTETIIIGMTITGTTITGMTITEIGGPLYDREMHKPVNFEWSSRLLVW